MNRFLSRTYKIIGTKFLVGTTIFSYIKCIVVYMNPTHTY